MQRLFQNFPPFETLFCRVAILGRELSIETLVLSRNPGSWPYIGGYVQFSQGEANTF